MNEGNLLNLRKIRFWTHKGRFSLSEGPSSESFLVWALFPVLTYARRFLGHWSHHSPPSVLCVHPTLLPLGLSGSSLTLPWPHRHLLLLTHSRSVSSFGSRCLQEPPSPQLPADTLTSFGTYSTLQVSLLPSSGFSSVKRVSSNPDQIFPITLFIVCLSQLECSSMRAKICVIYLMLGPRANGSTCWWEMLRSHLLDENTWEWMLWQSFWKANWELWDKARTLSLEDFRLRLDKPWQWPCRSIEN